MLDEICAYLKNWFDVERHFGEFTVSDGNISGLPENPQEGQYFRIIGSVFNDGIYKYPAENLHDETFDGAVWLLAIPPALESLAGEIALWMEKYGGAESSNMSPYNSESFGGYSYSKGGGGSADGTGSNAGSWKGAYAARLARWRKI